MVNKILFVDDEAGVLSSLKRLFLENDYEIYTALNGFEAIEFLKKGAVDIIVSDQRMPKMSGVEFLQHSKVYSPDSVRILLTGHADTDAAIDSINNGEVYRYFTKPWNDDEFKSAIRYAFELKRLREKNIDLQKLTQKQNLELKDLNANLEKKVKDQTDDIRKMLEEARMFNKKLDKSFVNSIKVFINMIKLRNPIISLHLKDTAKLTKAIARRMQLSEPDIKDIEVAALLHDIGKIGTSDSILSKAFGEMTSSEKEEYKRHPILGQAALESIENMDSIGIIVRHHHEEWNGHGFPDKLRGEGIPTGSRIIAAASDYDALLNGTLLPSKFKQSEAKEFIVKNSSQRYDPEVVAIFVSILTGQPDESKEKNETIVSSSKLKNGMTLARDIFTTSGFLLLNEGTKITDRHINNILDFEKAERKKYEIYVVSESGIRNRQ